MKTNRSPRIFSSLTALGIAITCVLALTGPSANATIIVGSITTAPDGSGGSLWTYPLTFDNSAIDSTQPTFFNVNDFGPLKTTGSLPVGWSFTSPGPSFTVTTPLVGPNGGLPGFQPNNPAVSDFVITFTSGANLGSGSITENLVLDTALTGPAVNANFFSQDRVASGSLSGSPNSVQQNVTVPTPGSSTTVPDTGSTFGLFAVALAALFGANRLCSIRLAFQTFASGPSSNDRRIHHRSSP